MVSYEYQFRTGRLTSSAILVAATCLSLYLYIRPALSDKTKSLRQTTVIQAKRHVAASEKEPPYPPDLFPGSRDVETAYGTIKVFEWGPEDGEKVLFLHGLGTPCIALGDMAWHFVSKGYRVMLFDLFGRGYSDAPVDLPYDNRLYTTQILLVLASSPLPWAGTSSFHLLGYSLGGALAAAFAAYHLHMLRSLSFICPSGLLRTSHISWKSRLLYSQNLFPEWPLTSLVRRRLEPKSGPSADVPEGDDDAEVDFDEVPLSVEKLAGVKVGDVIGWQLDANPGFVGVYMSTMRHAPIYGQHDKVWKLLSAKLARNREQGSGLGKTCHILGDKDSIIVKDEWIEDSKMVLGEDGVDIHVVSGGHEIAISKGREVADIIMSSWKGEQ